MPLDKCSNFKEENIMFKNENGGYSLSDIAAVSGGRNCEDGWGNGGSWQKSAAL